jgi:hypothetical protein
MIAIATRYLDALVSHDGSEVPLAPGCRRTELGTDTGSSGDAIRVHLTTEIMHGITGYRDVRWFVEGDDVIAFYVLDAYGTTVDIAERFRIHDGLIHEIEAIFTIKGSPAR